MKPYASNETRNLFSFFLPASFFLINDTHGHAAGDDIFVNIINTLNKAKRKVDQERRWGEKIFYFFIS
jgi:GGDEF domain-containing protein